MFKEAERKHLLNTSGRCLSLTFHCPFTDPSLIVHCPSTDLSLNVHCLSLPFHCLFSAFTLPFTAFSVRPRSLPFTCRPIEHFSSQSRKSAAQASLECARMCKAVCSFPSTPRPVHDNIMQPEFPCKSASPFCRHTPGNTKPVPCTNTVWEVDQIPKRLTELRQELVRHCCLCHRFPLHFHRLSWPRRCLSRVLPQVTARRPGRSTVLLVHCTAGCDRTGEVIGSYRLQVDLCRPYSCI